MNKDMSTIGVRFDIDKVGGGFYGAACWDIFWKAIALKDLCGAFFYEGDTNSTLHGRENVFCIATQASDAQVIQKIKKALSKNKAFHKVCASQMFSEGSTCTSEPLPYTGQIDAEGNFEGEGMAAATLEDIRKR